MSRFLRTFFLITAAILLGLAAAVLFFILRFKPNDYRPFLESRLSEQLGLMVKLGDLSVNWRGGLGLEARRLQITRGGREELSLEADSFFLQVNFLALFRRELHFSEFTLLRPQVTLTRRRQSPPGPRASVPSERPRRPIPQGAGGLAVVFSQAHIESGSFRYRDETQALPWEWSLKEIQADLERSVSEGKLYLRGEARLLSVTQADLEWIATLSLVQGDLNYEVHFQKDALRLAGEAFPFQTPTRVRGLIELNQFDLNSLSRFQPLWGKVSGKIEFEEAGTEWDEIKKNISARGVLEINNGAFRNFNFVDLLLRRVTVIPALRELWVGTVIPSSFQPIFNNPSTPFQVLQTNFSIQDGQALVRPLLLKDQHYLIEAGGLLNFEGGMDFKARLILFEELSQFLTGRVHELTYLTNPQGRVVLPFIYRGQWPSARPQPDLGYLAEALVVRQGARLIAQNLLGERP